MPREAELRQVTAAYGAITALFGVDIVAAKGKVTALLGPNGAGKTSTLRVLAGLLPVAKGSLHLQGQVVSGATPRRLAARGVCLIPEGRGIFPGLTVRENLQMQLFLRRDRTLADLEEMAFANFPTLKARRRQLAGTLSGGEQHMLALSRALTSDPTLLLIDEISMGLAPKLVDDLFVVVQRLAVEGRTIVLAEQLAEYAMDIADYVYLMRLGRVAEVGEPGDVRQHLDELYLGDASRSERAEVTTEAGRRYTTPNGSVAHRGGCPVLARDAAARVLNTDDARRPACDLCDELELSAVAAGRPTP